MANPSVVAITPADTWQKVATNVTVGFVWVDDDKSIYLQTYRMTGDPVPTDASEGELVSEPGMEISAAAGIDVYIMAVEAAGIVRVDV